MSYILQFTKQLNHQNILTTSQVIIRKINLQKIILVFGVLQDDDEADTVGCCTLKVENVEPSPPNILKVNNIVNYSILSSIYYFTNTKLLQFLKHNMKKTIVSGNLSISLYVVS